MIHFFIKSKSQIATLFRAIATWWVLYLVFYWWTDDGSSILMGVRPSLKLSKLFMYEYKRLRLRVISSNFEEFEDRFGVSINVHTEKSLNQLWNPIIFTIFRLIWNQMNVRLDQNQLAIRFRKDFSVCTMYINTDTKPIFKPL